MKTQNRFSWKELSFVCGAILFFFGCIASSHRTARTLDEGQVSFGGSYLRAEDTEDSKATPIQLLAIDGRVGVARGLDFGLMHTWDITEKNENQFATMWGDVKVQLSNRDNIIGKPIFSLGLMKGYVYDQNIKDHITSVPFMLSVPVSDYLTPTLMYRHEIISRDFVPSSLDNPRSTWSLGMEIDLMKPSSQSWTPKLGLSVGTFNSLTGGPGDRGLILNVGLSVDSPRKQP